jgi:cyanate permease
MLNLFNRLWHFMGTFPPWFLAALVLAFVSPFVLRKYREKRWIMLVWVPLMLVAVVGTLCLLYAFLSLNNLPNDAAGGFLGLGMILVGFGSSPFLLLLFFCIRFRPRRSPKNLNQRGIPK